MRILNKKHWISDVITGAGIGILSVERRYLLLPVFHRMLHIKNNRNLIIAPSVGVDSYGLGLACAF